MNIGKTIAELRTARDMSQQSLADALFVSRDLISKWETGTRRPEYGMIEKMAAVFKVPADSFFDKKDLIFQELSECVIGVEIPKEKLGESINRFLRKLPERTADVFMKRYYFLRTTSEIAVEYAIGENHVRSIISKTRRKLKRFLKEELS